MESVTFYDMFIREGFFSSTTQKKLLLHKDFVHNRQISKSSKIDLSSKKLSSGQAVALMTHHCSSEVLENVLKKEKRVGVLTTAFLCNWSRVSLKTKLEILDRAKPALKLLILSSFSLEEASDEILIPHISPELMSADNSDTFLLLLGALVNIRKGLIPAAIQSNSYRGSLKVAEALTLTELPDQEALLSQFIERKQCSALSALGKNPMCLPSIKEKIMEALSTSPDLWAPVWADLKDFSKFDRFAWVSEADGVENASKADLKDLLHFSLEEGTQTRRIAHLSYFLINKEKFPQWCGDAIDDFTAMVSSSNWATTNGGEKPTLSWIGDYRKYFVQNVLLKNESSVEYIPKPLSDRNPCRCKPKPYAETTYVYNPGVDRTTNTIAPGKVECRWQDKAWEETPVQGFSHRYSHIEYYRIRNVCTWEEVALFNFCLALEEAAQENIEVVTTVLGLAPNFTGSLGDLLKVSKAIVI